MRRITPNLPYTLLFIIILLSGGCAVRKVVDRDAKVRVNAPYKQVPSKSRIPGTQRPYIINGKKYYPLPSAEGFIQTGIASWYGKKFHGRKTANGETYDMHVMTAAHKTLPMDTHLLVKNLENDQEITVRVNDRGPFVKGRIIDLSYEAAQKAGIVAKGTGRVRITALGEAVKYRQGDITIERFKEHKDFTKGNFYVQVGSFSQKENAVRLKGRMLKWGKNAVIRTFTHEGKLFHRVQVRAGRTLQEAKHMENAFEESGFPGAFVIAH